MSKTVKDYKTDHNEVALYCIEFYFISCRRPRRCVQMCTNYNVDSNTKYSNYIELRIKCSN